MSIVHSYATKLAALRRRRDELRMALEVLRASADLKQLPAWKLLQDQSHEWRKPFEQQLLGSECTPYQQGLAQGYLAAMDCLFMVDVSRADAMAAELQQLDVRVKSMENRIAGISP